MHKGRSFSLWLLSVIFFVCGTAAFSKDHQDGFSAKAIADATSVESRTIGGTIQGMRTVLPGNEQPRGFVFEILKKGQWQIVFVKLQRGRAELGWASAPLDSIFNHVEVNGALDIVYLGGEFTVEFRGCAAHMCPHAFGIALFRLDDGKCFMAKVFDLEENRIEYSPELLAPEYKAYRVWLDRRIKDAAQSSEQ